MPNFPKKLRSKLEKRLAENATRSLPKKENLVDFCSNDYLGFSRENWIGRRANQILEDLCYGNGSTGSRLLSGNHKLYKTLEEKLGGFHHSGAALVFNSGYDANLGFFSAVPQRGDVIFYDELSHASIRDGIRLSNAKSFKFKHNDLNDLKLVVERSRNHSDEQEVYVITESVFSMDGDSPDLLGLANLCTANGYHLVVDEAHSGGIFGQGKGLCEQLEITDKTFARIVTFGKALGAHGAAVLGSEMLKQYLVNFSRSLIYTTALSPHTVSTILASYEFLVSEQGRKSQEALLENCTYFKQEIQNHGLMNHFIQSDSAIQSMKIEGNSKVKQVSKKFKDHGLDVKAILSPTVPKGEERLRFCIHSFNTKDEITMIFKILNHTN